MILIVSLKHIRLSKNCYFVIGGYYGNAPVQPPSTYNLYRSCFYTSLVFTTLVGFIRYSWLITLFIVCSHGARATKQVPFVLLCPQGRLS